MAPPRRKGAKKPPTAAGSVSRQWNVGDLVLAKVKGFPAWPATVSEPEKWGYKTADRRKVFVLFFGTEQIAFCNSADLEAFTEEKKQSLSRRQGRGADFVRAMKEINECYEKLKRGTEVEETSSGREVANADVANSLDPSANPGFKDQVDTHREINSQMKSSNSVTGRPELVYAAEDNFVVAPRDESYIKEATGDATATVKSKSSSKIQNIVVHCSDGGNNGSNRSANAIQNKYIRRIKHIRKSPDLFGCNDTDSSAFASNVSMGGNGSDINTVNSDACSLNEASAIDSNLKHEQSEIVEGSEYEVKLNKALDHGIKAVSGKKKRKPSRMKKTNNAGAQNANQSLQNVSENPKERCFDRDGDEHLPLLKRARVRMINSSHMEEEHNRIAQVQEKNNKEVIIASPSQIITSSNCENGSLAGGDSSALNGVLVNVSPKLLAPCSENGSQTPKVKKDQLSSFSMLDESFLPPSKRINRALKAMSANVAEEGACTELPPSIMPSSDRGSISAIKRCSCMIIDKQGGSDLELKGLDSCGIDCSNNRACSFSACSNPMILIEDNSSIKEDKQLTQSQQHESGKDVIPGTRHQSGEDLSDSMVCAPSKIDSQVLMHEKFCPNVDVKCCQVGNNQDSPGPSLPPNAGESIRPVIHSNESDTLDHGGINLDPVAAPNESGKLLTPKSITMPQNVVVVCEDMKRTSGDGSKINDMHEVVKEVKFKRQEENIISLSISNDCSGVKGALGILASSSLTDGAFRLPHRSPPNILVRNVSTSDSSNIHQNRSCSPDVFQKNSLSGPIDGWKDGAVANQQSRSMGKSTEAGHAALLYFEAMLGTLKRTKDNIGRATRIAMDCAKYGIATKVVESLIRSLENELNLRRKVDLFFLVDSIAQYSRGLKGDVGGVYPSAMQAVLPRLLSAVAPPGNAAKENRKQCLKVLRLWLKRKILPGHIIRHHIRELNTYRSSDSAGVYSRRSLKTERALDDPIREMEGMLVDEYGSNSSFQLSGFRMPCMVDDGGSDSDVGNIKAVTPDHGSKKYEVQEVPHTFGKHRHILEDVDGELEMEDVAPSIDVELNSICNVDGGNASQLDKKLPLFFSPRLPQDVPSSSPHPPSLPPPPPPPPPPPSPPTLHLISASSDQCHSAIDSKVFTDSQLQTGHGKTFRPMAQPLSETRNSQPIDAVQFKIPKCKEVQMQIPESPCSFNTYPVRSQENSRRAADGFTVHNKGHILRPPHRVSSDQFSFVHGEQRLKSQRVVPPPPSYSNRHHFVQSTKRENFYNNHERDGMRSNTRTPHEERWNTRALHEERWNTRAPHEERWNTRSLHEERWNTRSPYSGLPSPYGCHSSESMRSPGHGWRFPPSSMNYRSSTPFRASFEDAIPVSNRGLSFWRPRRTEITRH